MLRQIGRLDGLVPYLVADNWATFFITIISTLLSLAGIGDEFAIIALGILVIIVEINIARLIVTLPGLQIAMFLIAQLVGVSARALPHEPVLAADGRGHHGRRRPSVVDAHEVEPVGRRHRPAAAAVGGIERGAEIGAATTCPRPRASASPPSSAPDGGESCARWP